MGLLDALSSDDAKLGIALLSASGYSPTPMSFGQRLGGALGQFNADRQSSADRALKTKLLQSQIDENASQNMLRQGQLERQKRQDAYFMGGDVGGGTIAPPAATSAVPGSVLKSATGIPADAPPPGRGKFAEWSQQYGIPVDALVADYFSNGGKGIADMLMKRGTPDMQVSNGFAYDKNRVTPGYLPQLNMSQDGKASMVQIGPDGLPVVSAPRGAVETFGAYQGQAANFKPIKIYNPQTGREEYTSEGAVVQPQVGAGRLAPMAGRAGNVQSPGYSGGDRNAANAESILVMQNELKDPRLTDADRAGIQREIQRMQMQAGVAPSGNVAAGPSAAEVAQNEAGKVRAVDTAKADVVRDSAKLTDVKTANKFLGIVGQVEDVFKQGPTESGAGAMMDSAAAFVGKSTKGAEAAQRLKALGGWLVANVPRMEGPQSNFDVANYQVMAADVANDKLPLERRRAALDSIKTMMQGVAGGQPAAPSSDGAAAPKSFKEFGYSSQADVIKDAQNTILRNPKAKPEVMRRLKEMGISLNEGAW